MKIIDTTTYFEEDFIMDIRFNILNKDVDYFLVCEAKYTHSGNKKDIKFNKNNFPKFKDKIIHIIVEDEPKNLLDLTDKPDDFNKRINSIKRITHQRDYIKNYLNNFSKNDYIIHSDNDEIPNLKNFEFSKNNNKIIIFEQMLYYYKFNLGLNNIKWYGSKCCKVKDLKTFTTLREIKNKKYNPLRLDVYFSDKKYINLKIVKNGGWHFSNFKNIDELERKFLNDENYFEYELNINSREEIINNLKNKTISYDHLGDKKSKKRSVKTKLENMEENFLPDYIIENKQKYHEWFE